MSTPILPVLLSTDIAAPDASTSPTVVVDVSPPPASPAISTPWQPPKSAVQIEADRLGVHWTQVAALSRRHRVNKVARYAAQRMHRRR